jgi:hypothetical protein
VFPYATADEIYNFLSPSIAGTDLLHPAGIELKV